MAEKYRFFDAVEDEFGVYDREYNAQEFTDYFKALITTGVMKGAGNQLAVSTNGSSMITSVSTGIAFLLGRYYENDSPLELTHDTETLGNSRIDRIVIRMDLNTNARYVRAFIKKGVPSANPIAPTLTQTANLYEISLAQVRIVGGQTFIATNAITDERGMDIICPWAGSNILPNFSESSIGQPNGIATLDGNGDVPLSQLKNIPLPQEASNTQKGIVQIGEGISVSGGVISLVPKKAVHLRRSETQTIAANTWTDLKWNVWTNVLGDTGFLDTSNPYRIIIPSGVKRVKVSLSLEIGSGGDINKYLIGQIMKSDNIQFRTRNSVRMRASDGYLYVETPVLNVVQGDYFVASCMHDGSNSISIVSSYFAFFGLEVIE